jgi:DNA-binding response OmpR family regulator
MTAPNSLLCDDGEEPETGGSTRREKMAHLLLIAEADAEQADRLAVAARDEGWQVERVGAREDPLRRAELLLPTALVLAADLGNSRGWSLANRLRRHPVLSRIPLVLTAGGEQAQALEQHRRLALHADHYRTRPYAPRPLLAELAAQAPADRPRWLAELHRLREHAPPARAGGLWLWLLLAAAVAGTVLVLWRLMG